MLLIRVLLWTRCTTIYNGHTLYYYSCKLLAIIKMYLTFAKIVDKN